MNLFECKITGCALLIPDEGKWLWGDLHRGPEGTWVFNGAYGPKAQATEWQFTVLDRMLAGKGLIVTGEYFERRGVVVVPSTCGKLTQEAAEYLKA